MSDRKNPKTDETLETEIRILPDGSVVILELDKEMLELALALNPRDYRLRKRRRLLRRGERSSHAAKQNR
ncbi:MAG: hypothetical protein RMK89_00895 [Armatimonadota bacterium]|nr:hypothetical protein [Armatimonadota bacterium]MDW8141994.1 hypothetical protein [Armatimonadota bacterium]